MNAIYGMQGGYGGYPQQQFGFPSQQIQPWSQFSGGYPGFGGQFQNIDDSIYNIQGLNDQAFALLNGIGPNEQALYDQGIVPYDDPYNAYASNSYGYDDGYGGGWGADPYSGWGADRFGGGWGNQYAYGGYDDPYAGYGGWGGGNYYA